MLCQYYCAIKKNCHGVGAHLSQSYMGEVASGRTVVWGSGGRLGWLRGAGVYREQIIASFN